MAVHTINPNTSEKEAVDLCESEDSLVHRESFRPTRLHNETLFKNSTSQPREKY